MSSSLYDSPPAGPSAFNAHQANSPPPPGSIERDDYAAADQARQRFNKRGFFSSVSLPNLPLHNRKSKARKRTASPPPLSTAEVESLATQEVPDLVDLAEDPNLSSELEDYDKDVYRWAVLYENQRGATFFSTPYYSPLTLLPLDPPAFTIPSTSRSVRRGQPTVSLDDYPLPDGAWKWVSRAWMIDMRGDGQVQYDGFEYSRSFRSKKWGPNSGALSSQGLVRRRRWVRLMMRPAQVHHEDVQSAFSAPGGFPTVPQFGHHEEGATRPPSVILTISDDTNDTHGVWKGDVNDWDRCHSALRHLSRDGRKLELWAIWLGVQDKLPTNPRTVNPIIGPSVTIGFPKASSADELGQSSQPPPSVDGGSIDTSRTEAERLIAETGVDIGKAPKECVAAVIRVHGSDILDLFVYPDSRAKFLLLLGHVGLLPDIREGMGIGSDSALILDFWSYTQDVGADIGPCDSY